MMGLLKNMYKKLSKRDKTLKPRRVIDSSQQRDPTEELGGELNASLIGASFISSRYAGRIDPEYFDLLMDQAEKIINDNK